MSLYHACVWVDHRQAKVFAIAAESATEDVLHDQHASKHLHRRADHVGLGKAPVDEAFFAEVAAALKPFKAIMIAGPGTARIELAGYLAEHAPLIARRIWGIEAMDHPTDAQIVAAARRYFHGADRMHG